MSNNPCYPCCFKIRHMQDFNIYYESIVCYKLETVCICHQFAVYFFSIHCFGQKKRTLKKSDQHNLFAALEPCNAHCAEHEFLDKTPFLDSKFDFCN